MSRAPLYLFQTLAVCGLCVPAHAQAVISTRAGVVNFIDGAVTVNGQALVEQLGKFVTIPEGGELRTAQGRAEVLLTPGVFLRLGENSAVRMLAAGLADTRVELLAGSAIVDSGDPAAGTSCTLLYKTWSIRQTQKGSYRVDSDPPRVVARAGDVQVTGPDGPVKVEQGMEAPLAKVLVPEQMEGPVSDPLTQWDTGREESVAADNAIADNIQDPAQMADPDTGALAGAGLPDDAFTQFPMLGLPAVNDPLLDAYTSGVLGPVTPVMGFYSFYLPGYAYRPMLLGLPGLGLLGTGVGIRRLPLPATGTYLPGTTYLPRLPGHIGGTYGYGGTRYPIGGSTIGRPIGSRPVSPRPMAAPHMGVHMGGHR